MKKFMVIALLISGNVIFAEESQEVSAQVVVEVEAVKEVVAAQADLATLTALLEKAGEEALDADAQALFNAHPDVVISTETTVPFEIVEGKLVVSARYFRAAQAAVVALTEEAPAALQEASEEVVAVVAEADLVEVLTEETDVTEEKKEELKS
jgi:hypothetical protein